MSNHEWNTFARGVVHCRSDIDIAVALSPESGENDTNIIDRILMSSERNVSILRLDDEDESPFVVQESFKGKHLVKPDLRLFYEIADRVLHEAESIRIRRKNYVPE